MKKLLTIILALMLCLSTAVVFSACDSSSDDVDVNAPSNSEKPTEKPTEPPSPTNTEVAVKSFNKIDLAKFLSVTDNSIEELKKASAKAEVNISLPDESGSLTAAIKDGVFYLAVTEEGYGTDEAFGKISEDKISIYSLVDGAWEQVEEIDLNASAPSASGALTNPEDIISKIKIPELKKEYLTEKNNMLLVSNDYIYELITNNITAIAGEDIPEEDLEEMKASVKDSLKEAGLEVFVATGAEEITKLAISIDPAEDESEFNSAYIEIALTDDAKALKSIKAEWTASVGKLEMNEVRTSKIELTTILSENELVGAKVKADIYDYEYDYVSIEKPEMDKTEDGEFDDIISSLIPTRTENILLTKTSVNAELDFSQLKTETGKVLVLDVDHVVESAYEVKSTLNAETGEWDEEMTKLDSVSEFADNNGTIDVSITMNGANKADFALKAVVDGEQVTGSGYLATGDIEFPAIPEALKGKLN